MKRYLWICAGLAGADYRIVHSCYADKQRIFRKLGIRHRVRETRYGTVCAERRVAGGKLKSVRDSVVWA